MSNTLRIIAVLVFGIAALSGCGLFGKRSSYEASRESRPLEIPPGLDAPSTTGALDIPESGSTPAEGRGDGAARVATAPQAILAGDEASLSLADGPAGAWRRIGLALQRSAVGEVVASDEAAGTYTLKTEVVERKGGMISRMFGRDKATSQSATRVVRVVAEGEGSAIRIEDENGDTVEDEAARRVIAALKQRLG